MLSDHTGHKSNLDLEETSLKNNDPKLDRRLIKGARIRSDSFISSKQACENSLNIQETSVRFLNTYYDDVFDANDSIETGRTETNPEPERQNDQENLIINTTAQSIRTEDSEAKNSDELQDFDLQMSRSLESLVEKKPNLENTIELEQWNNKYEYEKTKWAEERDRLIQRHNELNNQTDNDSRGEHMDQSSVATADSEPTVEHVGQTKDKNHQLRSTIPTATVTTSPEMPLPRRSNLGELIAAFDTSLSTKNQNLHLKKNYELELNYLRNDYTFLLFGSKVTEFAENLYKLTEEIKRNKKVSEPKIVTVEFSTVNNKPCVKIITESRDEYFEMMRPWPERSFISGVVPKAGLLNIQMVIDCPTREIPDGKGGRAIEKDPFTEPLTLRHINCLGLYLPTRFGKESQKVKCYVLDLKSFFDRTMEETVQIGNIRRRIRPKLKITPCCQNCGELAMHRECANKRKCFLCASADPNHDFNKCNEQICCVNCGQNHPTNSNECNMWKLKIVSDNDYIATILVGVISSKKHILKFAGANIKIDPLYTVDSELNSLKIKSLINESLKNRDAEIMDLKIKMNDTVLPAIHRHNEAIGQVEIQIKNLDAKFDGGLKMLSGQIQSFDDKLTNIESRVEKR